MKNPIKRPPPLKDTHQLRNSYPKGHVLFHERDERDCAYIIEKGEVEISVQKDGKRIPLVRLSEGEVFGETALLGPGPRSATAIVTEDCEVFRISPHALHDRIMHLDPLVGLLMSLLINRYRQWRYVPPDAAAAMNALPQARENLKQVDRADDFLRALNKQREVALKELRMAQEITQAIEQDQFSPHLQPIVSLPDQKLVGFEALIRWHHPEKGMIPPMEFIPVAERTNVVWHLDMLMLRRACRVVQEIQKAAGDIGRKLYVSVNLSGVHFDSEEFATQIDSIVKESHVDPAQIVLEITESALMGNPTVAEKVLTDLKKQGLTIALDDFGTGYSSLSYLHRFSIDILKIDRAFVQDIHRNSKSLDVVRAIVSLAKTFNLSIVAEGVESRNEIYSLAGLGCNNGQGYFFSKPLPIDEVPGFIKESIAKHG
ncbi:MAG: EAL domain-containing protein [Proteobacteria bacterium]|nr:EAL domain-containing protein [Pseudomonadota bacterium]